MDDHEHNRELAKLRAENARIKAEIDREEKLLKKETDLRDKILKDVAERQKQRDMLKKTKKWIWIEDYLLIHKKS